MIGRGLFRQGGFSPQRFGTRVRIHRLPGLWRCCIHFRDSFYYGKLWSLLNVGFSDWAE